MDLRIATRGSRLALLQSSMVGTALGVSFELVEVTTKRPAGSIDRKSGLKGIFTSAVDAAVVTGAAELAVHSLKDLPTTVTPGLVLAATPARAPPGEMWLGPGLASLGGQGEPLRVGTGSVRRQAQLRRWSTPIAPIALQGNVETRIARWDAGEIDAIILAQAGLARLGIARGEPIPTERLLPAAGQGALGVVCRADDDRTRDLLAGISDQATLTAVTAERAFVAALDGDCDSPIAALGQVSGAQASFSGAVFSPDGARAIQESFTTTGEDLVARATALGQDFGRRGAAGIMGGS